jgi:DNA polymerase-1
VCADEAQLEVRIASVVYNEPRLIEICNDFDKDIHSAITAQAFGRQYDEIKSGYDNKINEIVELRVKGKGITFGIIYQEQASGLAYNLDISEKEAGEFIDNFYGGFPDLYDNIEQTKRLLIQQGYLDNYFGFRRSWRNHKKEDHKSQREGVNHLIQSLAWNVLELAMIEVKTEIENRNLKSRLVLQIYDSIIVEALEEELDEVAKIVKDKMESAIEEFDNINRVRLKTDVEIGDNLNDLEKHKL